MSHKRQRKDKKPTDPIKVLNKYMNKELKSNMSVKKKIGGGSFGTVYKGKLDNEAVAIKVEISSESDCLIDEARIYQNLHNDKNHKYLGIPRSLYFNSNNDSYRILVLPLYGRDLQNVLRKKAKNKIFSFKTVCFIARQVLDHLKYVHEQGIVHKDIKPENLVLRSNKGMGRALIHVWILE